MTYYLVCPANDGEGGDGDVTGPCYWMRDGGERWIHFVKGSWIKKNEKDVVRDVIKVRDVSELDWRETPLRTPQSSSGWLSRGGRYFGCPPYWHDKFASYVLGIKVEEMETSGWVRVNDTRHFTCERKLTSEQKNWLSKKGYKIHSA